jgi:hypothetical protein
LIKALHVLPGLGDGAERLAANAIPTLGRERVEAGVVGLPGLPFGTDLEESLAQDGISVWHPGKRQGLDPQTLARLGRVLDRVGPYGGSALSLYLQEFVQRAPSLDEHERPR